MSDQFRSRARWALFIGIVASVLLPRLPFGGFVGFPLMLLHTYLHEMGHGLAGILVGGTFEKFVMFTNGSGVAYVSSYDGTGIRRAVVSAGGLVGPAVGALLCFVAARRELSSRLAIGAFAAGNLVALALVVRSETGFVFVSALSALCAIVAALKLPRVQQTTLVFLAIQLGLSVFSRGDYLFVEFADTSAGKMPSDVANMATALGGPYWVWGAACGLFSVVMLLVGGLVYWRAIAPTEPS